MVIVEFIFYVLGVIIGAFIGTYICIGIDNLIEKRKEKKTNQNIVEYITMLQDNTNSESKKEMLEMIKNIYQ